jgi:transposase
MACLSARNKEESMTQERLTMRKIREILRLKYEAGLSNRAIAGACNISNSTVGEYLRRAEAAGVGWPLGDLSEDELYKKLFGEPVPVPETKSKALPDWEDVRKELVKKGVTLELIWMEYIEAHPDGYKRSQFGEYYRRWKKERNEPRMRNVHIGGEQMQVDYAGIKIRIVDPETGEVFWAPVFVAVLPASNYAYVEAQSGEDQCNWNNGHVRAFIFYGGVVKIVMPDNLKTGVTKPDYYDPDINGSYQELAEHYQIAILPARVKKPRDKGKVENAVQNVERWVIAPLRNRTFFSLAEANRAIWEKLDEFNNKMMLAAGRTRRQEFEEIDRPNLRPLPEKPYEFAICKTVRVNIDYHVEFDKHFYSAPHALIHEAVDLRVTEHLVHIIYKNKDVAVHPRSSKAGGYTTLREHMPPNHQFMHKINANQLLSWAEKIGPQTQSLVQATLKSRTFPEQAFRSCLGIINLAKKHPASRMEQACEAALQNKSLSYKAVKDELKWLMKQDPLPVSETLPAHDNIRGHEYYQ